MEKRDVYEFPFLLAAAREFAHPRRPRNLLLGQDHIGRSYFAELGAHISTFSIIQQWRGGIEDNL